MKSHHSFLSMTIFAPLTPRPDGFVEKGFVTLEVDVSPDQVVSIC